jgi:hypothetical protein
LEEARKDASHRRSQENLIALAMVSGPLTSLGMLGFVVWSSIRERKQDRLRDNAEVRREEADRRFWHAIARMERAR